MKLLIVLKQIVSLVLVLKFTFFFFTIFRLEFSLPRVEILKIQNVLYFFRYIASLQTPYGKTFEIKF